MDSGGWARTALAVAVTAGALGAGASAAGTAKAPPAALDFSFGVRGTATLGRGYQVYATAMQRDGKIVVVGDQQLRSGLRLMAARLTPGGQLDRSFNGGHVELGPREPSGGAIARAAAIQRDGKIVLAGVITDRSGIGQRGMLVERLLTTGALDRGFGSGGRSVLLHGTAQSAANAVAVQRDGKIVVAGNGPGNDGLQRIALARLDSRGSLDRGFGAAGVVISQGSEDLGRLGTAAAVALQSDGKILLAGSSRPNLQLTQGIVARFTSGGGLDRSFATGGRYIVPAAIKRGGAALLRAIVVGHGGLVAAGAATSDGATPAYTLALRLSSSGRTVNSFGAGGLVALPSERGGIPPSTVPGANAVAFARGGVVVLAGSYRDSGRSQVALWSLSGRGSLMRSGTTRTTLNTSLGLGSANGVAIDSQGRIVVAGASNNLVTLNSFALRYHGFGP